MVLGFHNGLSPNVWENSARLAKYANIFRKHFLKAVDVQNGVAVINFKKVPLTPGLFHKNPDVNERIYKDFMELVDKGMVRGVIAEDYSGYSPFETRSVPGQLKKTAAQAVNASGIFISTMEQFTRSISALSTLELIYTKRDMLKDKLTDLYADDSRLSVVNMLDNTTEVKPVALTELVLRDSHGTFGKMGRPQYLQGLGGSFFFPFMTVPHIMFEAVITNASKVGSSPASRRALISILTAFVVISGLYGLPGAELLKELLEEIEKKVTGTEEDLDFWIRSKVYEITGSPEIAKAVTRGIFRPMGADITQRVNLPVPIQEPIKALLALNSTPEDLLGVQGSIITNMARAWQLYSTEGSTASVLAAMSPVALSNIFKAVDYDINGVTSTKDFTVLPPEKVTTMSKAMRALGVNSDQIATEREAIFFGRMQGTRFDAGLKKYRDTLKRLATSMQRAREYKDYDEYNSLKNKYDDVILEVENFVTKNDITGFDYPAFHRSILKAVEQRTVGGIRPEDVRKHARDELKGVLETLGVDKK
jgi:hypothetical protein